MMAEIKDGVAKYWLLLIHVYWSLNLIPYACHLDTCAENEVVFCTFQNNTTPQYRSLY
jgi:hypothetical protein